MSEGNVSVAAIPKNESDRLTCLRSLRILDTKAERIYDDVVDLAAQICDSPISMVSLVDSHRQWFKAKRGLDMCETPREISFCAHTILSDEPLLVCDMREDERFRDHPLVAGPTQVRFYVGVPLVMGNGQRVGTLCAIDMKPKTLEKSQMRSLELLARQVVAHLESRAGELERQELLAELENHKLKVAAASKMAALGEMAAGIAHEVNNPLTAILAWAGEIIDMAEQKRVDQNRLLQIGSSIERVGLRISKTVRSLRTFAQDGALLEAEKCDMRTILDDTLELCRQRFSDHKVALIIKEPSESIFIHCRAVEISQVLLNLLNNSFDSIVNRDDKWIECNLMVVGEEVEISVQDSGPPLPFELQDKIMNPFFTTKAAGKGTGLGLSISQRIVQSHGGSLFVDPHDEHAKFVLRLPLYANAA